MRPRSVRTQYRACLHLFDHVNLCQQLCDETEIQYQQRIIVLEQQITRLEGQLERLRESAVLEKKELQTTHTKLYKVSELLST